MAKKRKVFKKTSTVPTLPVPPAQPIAIARFKVQMLLGIAGMLRKAADMLAELAREL